MGRRRIVDKQLASSKEKLPAECRNTQKLKVTTHCSQLEETIAMSVPAVYVLHFYVLRTVSPAMPKASPSNTLPPAFVKVLFQYLLISIPSGSRTGMFNHRPFHTSIVSSPKNTTSMLDRCVLDSRCTMAALAACVCVHPRLLVFPTGSMKPSHGHESSSP